jgi:hypothetical protein
MNIARIAELCKGYRELLQERVKLDEVMSVSDPVYGRGNLADT